MVDNSSLNDMTHFVTKENGTEPAFNNAYWDEHRAGIYVDANTGKPLFSSVDKFDSGTGWPSFSKPIDDALIVEKQDRSLGVLRTEIRSGDSHLGHVFNDGPTASGNRYCVNSAALRFIPFGDLEKEGYVEYESLFDFEKAYFAAGCFWGVEHILKNISGVVKTTVGYMGGNEASASYSIVSSGLTSHAETVEVVFDPNKISYAQLLDYFWRLHDPTQLNRQGVDVGSQYRSVIFYNSDDQRLVAENSKIAFDKKGVFDVGVVTQIVPAKTFFVAEDYHQDYFDKNPSYSCHQLRED